MSKIHTILIQTCPRQDTLCAIYLLRREGSRKYPGVENARIEYWGNGTVSPNNITWKERLQQGILPVGILGSHLDEHPSPDFSDRKVTKESTTFLVAKDLGIDRDPLYRNLIKMVTEADLKIVDGLAVSSIIKGAYRNPDIDPEDIYRWAEFAFDRILDHQERFNAALGDLERPGMITHRDVGGVILRIAGVDSDNPALPLAASYRKYAAVIQYRSTGHINVFSNTKMGVSLRDVAVAIRKAELVAEKRCKDAKEYRNLLDEAGQMTLVPNWCYQLPGEALLNWSETAPKLTPTLLSVEQVHEIVTSLITVIPQTGVTAARPSESAASA